MEGTDKVAYASCVECGSGSDNKFMRGLFVSSLDLDLPFILSRSLSYSLSIAVSFSIASLNTCKVHAVSFNVRQFESRTATGYTSRIQQTDHDDEDIAAI